jgi:hypothetical protein
MKTLVISETLVFCMLLMVEIYALLGYYTACSGTPLLLFQDKIPVPSSSVKESWTLDFLNLEDGTDTLSRNIGKGFPLNAAKYPRTAQISTSQWTPEITHYGYSTPELD